MTSINILGTCICRDVFRVSDDKDYSIPRFVQSVSPVTVAISEPVIDADYISILEEQKEYPLNNFDKRNIALELTGQAFDFLDEEKADWLMIDMGCCRYELMAIAPDQNGGRSAIYH